MATILLIDHDTPTRLALQTALQEQGYQVTTTDDRKSALEVVAQLQPHLVIGYGISPQIDSLAIFQQIKNQTNLVQPFCLLIAESEQVKLQLHCLDHAVDDFLVTPLDLNEVLLRIRWGLRTQSLTEKVSDHHQQLTQTVLELERAKEQLIQSEKFSSLGQMVSGITHEINNPVSFVKGNVTHIAGYTQDLMDLIEMYAEDYPEPSEAIQEQIEEMDLEFVREDLPQVIDSLKNGTERIQKLVQSLRNFYKVDDSESKPVDIHSGLDDILEILQAKLKGKAGRQIQVVKEYGKLPKVECYPGQLNQVFMNLLNNAIDALEDRRMDNSLPEPTIWIKTEVIPRETSPDSATSGAVIIRIQDNGIGIPDPIKDKIFQPFFTTKSRSSGTGFGLSICQEIVVKIHGGKLKCVSPAGEGTEFTVEIPLTELGD